MNLSRLLGAGRPKGERWTLRSAIAPVAAIASVLLFFSGFVQYAFATGMTPLPPVDFITPFILLGLLLVVFRRTGRDDMSWKIAGWCAIYLLVSVLGVFLSPEPDTALGVLRLRILSVAFLLCMRGFVGNTSGYRWAGRFVLLVHLASIGFNVYEAFNPLTFSFSYGRAAGLYQNPNISGGALVLGMLLALPVVPRRLRELFILATGIAVLLTFSRGALIGWLAATLFLLRGQAVRPRLLAASLALLAIAGPVAAMKVDWLANATDELLSKDPELASRLTLEGSAADENTGSRLSLAETGLRLFEENPMMGAGLGATESVGTHNMYVMHIAEHGVFGVLLFPGLLYLIFRRGWALRQQPTILAMAVFFAVWGIFSHNALEELHGLFAMAMALAPESVALTVWGMQAPAVRRRPSLLGMLALGTRRLESGARI